MSSKRPKKSKEQSGEHELDEEKVESDEVADESEQDDEDDAEYENGDEPEEDEDEELGGDEEEEEFEEDEEISLDQLSQAYARVRKEGSEDGEDDPAESETSADSSAEKLEDEDSPGNFKQRNRQEEPAPTPEVDDDAACPVSPESIVESILFVGAPKGVKLTSRKIASLLRDVSPKEVAKAVKKLNARYESDDAAFRIHSDKGSLKMVLAESLNEFRQEFFGRNKQVRLSQTAIDVMAVVAYNQPVSREQVDKIRSKPSGSILNQLVKRNLLIIKPQQNDKVKRFATTDKFLDFFNLEEIADLPQSHEVSDLDELAD